MAARALLGVITASWLALGLSIPVQAEPVASPLKVAHNQLVDPAGKTVHLAGVNRSGTEYACIQGWDIFDGPSDDASVAAIATWGTNVVRIGLNEDCWLGINGVKPEYSGPSYQKAITDYVERLHRHGLYAIVALMWAAPGKNPATWQEAMADQDHATAFWSSVATAFRADGATLLDLYGEPSWVDWSCWVDGCTYADKYGSWQTAGMQKMLDAVRQAGAHNVVIVSGADYANNLESWLEYAPKDSSNQIAAGFHVYGDNTCHDKACWDSTVREVAMRVPVVTGELGERADGSSCGHEFLDAYMSYARSNGISVLAWAWDTWNPCSTLITDYSGTPTAFGAAFRSDITSGTPYGSLSYIAARPPRPIVELDESDRRQVMAVGAAALLGIAGIAVFGLIRRRPKRRTRGLMY